MNLQTKNSSREGISCVYPTLKYYTFIKEKGKKNIMNNNLLYKLNNVQMLKRSEIIQNLIKNTFLMQIENSFSRNITFLLIF